MGNKAQHTPGPWRVARSMAYDDMMGEVGHTVLVVIGERIIHLTHAGYVGTPEDYAEQVANARLIAAAPEMYDLLAEVAPEIDANWWCPTCARELNPVEVTNEEFCAKCGTYLGGVAQPEWQARVRDLLAKARGE